MPIASLRVAHVDSRGRQGQFVDQTAPFQTTARGSVTWSAGLQIDTDGARSSGDRTHQSTTSLRLNGRSVDASVTPYVALPPSVAKAAGLHLGDLVKVTLNGKSSFAIFADSSDDRSGRKLGEGSPALHSAIGHPLRSLNDGLDSGVSFEAYPGSGAKLGVLTNGFPDTAAVNAFGARLESPASPDTFDSTPR